MKLITTLSMSAFVLMPAIAFAAPSTTGTVSEPNQEQASNMAGQTSYPDRAAVKKIEALPSLSGASSQQKPESMSVSGSAYEQPGLMDKAKEFTGTITGTITGRSVGSNESESADVSKGGAIGQASPPKDESKYPDWAAVKKIEGPTSQ
jgi:hypothetical protein